jgi:dinuclear metal center YbgI/SA1388 family protein
MSIRRIELENFLNDLFLPLDFSDYCPNGLQIEGKEKIEKIAFSLSATRESIEKSVEKVADALIVHHGLFWNFHGSRVLTGPFKKRVGPLVKNDINLFAYHLPLDANLKVGNAKTLASLIGLKNLKPFGDYKGSPMGVWGEFSKPFQPVTLKNKLKEILSHEVYLAEPMGKKISTMGIITGGANSQWTFAKELGLDSYLTGEMSEHDFHESKEANIAMFAGGHHATEKFGILALMNLIENKFKIEVLFIDSDNPA